MTSTSEIQTTLTDFTPLLTALGDDTVIIDDARMDKYRWDRAVDPNAGVPLAVVRAGSSADIQEAVRFAAAHNLPIVPRGAGTGLSGGSSAIDGCIVISTERMQDIRVDPITRTAVVQPGALNAQVKEAAAKHDLWYPPDPSSFEICSIGGNVATNAGGLCCVKYGVTTDYVLGLTVVLANGDTVRLGGPRLKDVAGLSLTKLFVGSEGTLGVVTEAVLRLIPKQRPPATMIATFSTLDDATSTVLEISRQLRPSMLEFMDQPTINAVEDMTKMGLDRSAAAMLIIQSDEPDERATIECEFMASISQANGATEVFSTSDPEESESFVFARRAAIPAVERTGTLLLEDVGVPVSELGALVKGIAAISQSRGVTIATIAHAGDGNTHPLIVFDPSDADMASRAKNAYGEVMNLAIRLGGTITGEHGVGRLKKPWLADYLGTDALALNQRIKNALDPQGIMNPGAMF